MADKLAPRVCIRLAATALLIPLVVAVPGVAQVSPSRQAPQADQAAPQETFATPEQAVQALLAALSADDTDRLLAIFGSDYASVVLGSDPASGRVMRRRVFEAFQHKLVLRRDGQDRVLLVAGENGWPMPIPLIKQDGRWFFDTAAGEEEILDRRVGEDELAAIEAMQAFVQAERAYAASDRAAGKPAEYAQYIQSTPGSTDGLWWDSATAAKAGPSPLAAFADAQKEFLENRQPGDPYKGYYFRVLTAQGPSAPGGACSYLEDGRMTGGFALLAWPASYRETGVMTFIVNQDGRVLQRDLGEDTGSLFHAIQAYDPDRHWRPAERQ